MSNYSIGTLREHIRPTKNSIAENINKLTKSTNKSSTIAIIISIIAISISIISPYYIDNKNTKFNSILIIIFHFRVFNKPHL